MKTTKFKVGDKVIVNTEPRSRLTDYLADIQSGLIDRDITTQTADKLECALFDKTVCKVSAIEGDPDSDWGGYIVRLPNSKVEFPWQFEAEDLTLVEAKK